MRKTKQNELKLTFKDADTIEITELLYKRLLDDNIIKAYCQLTKNSIEVIKEARITLLVYLLEEYLKFHESNDNVICVNGYIIKIKDFKFIIKNNPEVLEELFTSGMKNMGIM